MINGRNFQDWLAGFRDSISSYTYYADFEKVYSNVEGIKVELNILNSLIASKSIEEDFEEILTEYPKTLKCIPILLAVRKMQIFAMDAGGEFVYDFARQNHSIKQYKIFMRKTGLFDLLEHHIIHNLVDYVTGVETGLDSNGRKNRGGHQMENLVEGFLSQAGLIRDKTYFKEMSISELQEQWSIDLSAISNQGKTEKRFDFVVKQPSMIHVIETNFYASGGSKLNETARSYKNLALEASSIQGINFVWFTDGAGWRSARNNLEETFDVMKHVYSIKDMEAGIVKKLFGDAS